MAHGITATDSMMSVRAVPWHGLGEVLDAYPESVDEALDKSGLGWQVVSGGVVVANDDSPLIVTPDELAVALERDYADTSTFTITRAEGGKFRLGGAVAADQWKGNLRGDNGGVLGIVGADYQVVDNRDAFRFLDALIGSDLHFETAGSLWGGRRVWVLARLPEHVEMGGDTVGTYVYVANSHDGSMAVTAAVTPVRIVCANTLGAALRRSDHGVGAQRTYRFWHTGDLSLKFHEARKVMGMTVNYERQFKELADRLASEKITQGRFEKRVLQQLWTIDDDMGKVKRRNRERTIEQVLEIWNGRGDDGDTRGNSPGTKWCAFNAVGEHLDYGRRYTKTTNQVQRSFEDVNLKQRALDLIVAA